MRITTSIYNTIGQYRLGRSAPDYTCHGHYYWEGQLFHCVLLFDSLLLLLFLVILVYMQTITSSATQPRSHDTAILPRLRHGVSEFKMGLSQHYVMTGVWRISRFLP